MPQAKTPLAGEVDAAHGGSVRFAANHEVYQGRERSIGRTSAPVSPRAVDRQSITQRVDDAARAQAQEALDDLLKGNERFRQVE